MVANLLRLLPMVTAVFLLVATEARAATVKFCIEHTGTFEDNDFGEDNWLTDQERDARGAYVVVRKGIAVLYASYLGDGLGTGDPGAGCTSELAVSSANGAYVINVFSFGDVNGNDIQSLNSSGNTIDVASTFNVSGGSGTYDVEVAITAGSTAFKVFNVFNAGAYALYRHAGGMTDQEYNFRLTSGPSEYSFADNEIRINDDASPHTDNKFVIVHETAHALLGHRTGGAYWVGSDVYGASNNCDEEPSSHSMRSREHDLAAFSEGFAHFYAADVWNDHDDTDCSFRYYKSVEGALRTVDCESTNTRFETYYNETQCVGGAGYGVELDWLRAFWDVHTDGSAPDPTFTDMVDWIDFAIDFGWLYGGVYGRNGAYDALNATAPAFSDIESTWDQSGVGNALDGI